VNATLYILNGPNLNLLGTREPAVYGHATLADVEAVTREEAARHGLRIEFRQSNHEGELIDWIHEAAAAGAKGLVINAGAYTHTSVALHDAVKATGLPLVEVHLSNVFAREPFRHHSFLSPVAKGVICGFGPQGYALAVRALAESPASA
jgi:3-dehydroquinate dehydratase-2